MVSVERLRQRIVDGDGPLVLRSEFAVWTSACDNPRCRTVGLTCQALDPSEGESSGSSRRVVELSWDPPARGSGKEFSLLFDVDSDRITMRDGAPNRDDAERLRAALAGGQDETLLSVLRRRWRRAKGLEDRESWRDRDWTGWDGALVSRCDIYPDSRDFVVVHDGRSYWAEDLYCVNPRCTCRQVVLNLHDLGARSPRNLGVVTVEYDARRAVEIEEETADKATLRSIWRALKEQEDLRDEFRRRHRDMKAIGDELEKLARDAPGTRRTTRRDDSGAGATTPAAAMPIGEIVAWLRWVEKPFPRAIVQQARERREEITPLLLAVIEDTIERAEELSDDTEYLAHIYALLLLAEFREQRALPLVIRLASLPEEFVEELLDEVITDDLPRVLGSVARGETGPVLALAADRSASVWCRGAALRALLVMVIAGDLTRTEAVELLAEFARWVIREAREGKREPDELVSELVGLACELYPEELLPEIRELYDLDLVDLSWISRDEVQRTLDRGREPADERFKRLNSPVTNTIDELAGWWCFREDEYDDRDDLDDDLDDDDLDDDDLDDESYEAELSDPSSSERRPRWSDPPIEPIIRDQPKIGRNDPCPCGSGKKYKRCCLKE